MANSLTQTDATPASIALVIEDRIASEPAYHSILYRILAYIETPRTFHEIEEEVVTYPEMKIPLQTPQVFIGWLRDCGAIEEIVLEPKPSLWQLTPAGNIALQKERANDKLEALLREDASYKTIYLMVLKFCKQAKSRIEIEAHLSNHPLLENPKIYPSYFIDMLEKADGLIWDSAWKTTQKAYAKLS